MTNRQWFTSYQLILCKNLVYFEFETNIKMQRPPKRLKRNFVKENSRGKLRKQPNQNFLPGTFTIHHPSRCYHTLNSHPIHLRHTTDGKEFVRILTQEHIRDLLVPSISHLYPAIWHINEMDRLKRQALRLTNDQKAVIIRDKENMIECLRDASEKRKMLFNSQNWNKKIFKKFAKRWEVNLLWRDCKIRHERYFGQVEWMFESILTRKQWKTTHILMCC